ncbi:MAG: hypothetical protein COA42_00150 [Alteromonadaceae bacterium]|nr:MAG: hypothetical protein COA42_00150 [Alteromonadaceae bacterium]
MQINSFAFIIAAEVAVVFLLLSVVLALQNRNLKNIIKKLQARMQEIVGDLKVLQNNTQTTQEPTPPSVSEVSAPDDTASSEVRSYLDQISEQIQKTRDQHKRLGSDRDIVLDLAPDSELPRRAAALRYAMLLAEKEALTNTEDGEPKWELLKFKYEQIFSFYEDYTTEPENGASQEELDMLAEELTNAKKRISNLEKFKALYFDLEEKWAESKTEAQTHYDNLSQMASKIEDTDDSEAFEGALMDYHAAYSDVNQMIESGIESSNIVEGGKLNDATSGELKHLRSVAADQHRIISELQNKLKLAAASDNDISANLIDNLKTELNKQQRFIQESETCIQLMEDELRSANKEGEQLRSRLKALPAMKTQLKELGNQKDEFELKVYAITSENRKLLKKLKEERSAAPVDDGRSTKLKRELIDFEARYAALEEKYLDLKIQQ